MVTDRVLTHEALPKGLQAVVALQDRGKALGEVALQAFPEVGGITRNPISPQVFDLAEVVKLQGRWEEGDEVMLVDAAIAALAFEVLVKVAISDPG